MNCPSCGNPEIKESSTFCPKCQTFLVKPKHAHQSPFPKRLLAFVIDLFSLWGTPLVILYLLNLYVTEKSSLTAIFHRSTWVVWGALANIAIFISLSAFLLWAFFVLYLILLLAKGISPGKRYFNLRVEKIDASHLDFWSMFVIREIIGRIVSTIPLFLGYLWALWDKNGQTWHDKMANTVVLQLSKTAIEREKRNKKKAAGGIMISMRDNAAAILFILVGFFVLSLVFTGGLGGANIIDDVIAFLTGEAARGVVAKINDQTIQYEQYNNYYNNKLKEYREKQGTDPQGYQLEQFEQQIWDELVNQILIGDYVRNSGLMATDEEVIYELMNNPPQDVKNIEVFQTNGVFDRNLYLQAWQNTSDPQFNQFWASMEMHARETIPQRKLTERILSTIRITEDELKEEYKKRNQKAIADYVFFDPAKYSNSDVTFSDSEIQKYYNEHKEDFKEPAKRKIHYVIFSTVPTKADSQRQWDTAREVYERAINGADFAELAQDFSKDPGSASKGGDLGFFGRNMMAKPFEEAAFNANVGEIVGPVQSQFGLHVIKVEDKKVEDGEEQVKASHVLIKFEPSDETVNTAIRTARYFADQLKEEPWDAVVARENFKVDSTDYFQEGGFIPGIGRNAKASRFIFSRNIGTTSHVFRIMNGYFVLKISDGYDERFSLLKDVKDRITNRMKREKSEEMAAKAAEEFLANLAGQSLGQAAGRDSLEVKTTKEFARNGYVDGGVGRDAAFIGAAFGLSTGEISKPIKGVRGYYVIQLQSMTPFDEQEFDIKRQQLEMEMIQAKQRMASNQWMMKLRESATIKDYRDRYFL